MNLNEFESLTADDRLDALEFATFRILRHALINDYALDAINDPADLIESFHALDCSNMHELIDHDLRDRIHNASFDDFDTFTAIINSTDEFIYESFCDELLDCASTARMIESFIRANTHAFTSIP